MSSVLNRLAKGEGKPGDVDLIAHIAAGIGGTTICALGDAAAWPILAFITKFRRDFEERIKR
jgi:NADH-quinone oxidoreductase subunit F